MRLELPDGQWAELAEPRKVPERKRRPYTTAAASMGPATMVDPATGAVRIDSAETKEQMDAVLDALILALVVAWSYGVEVTLEAVQDLPGDAYDALRNACLEHAGELMPDYGASPDPKALTVESSNSHTASPATVR